MIVDKYYVCTNLFRFFKLKLMLYKLFYEKNNNRFKKVHLGWDTYENLNSQPIFFEEFLSNRAENVYTYS